MSQCDLNCIGFGYFCRLLLFSDDSLVFLGHPAPGNIILFNFFEKKENPAAKQDIGCGRRGCKRAPRVG